MPPAKSVREMSELERKHYSLSARTFHAVVLLAVIISLAAVTFGFFLYSNAIRRDYTQEAFLVSKAGVAVTEETKAREVCGEILDIYAAEGGGEETESYLARFDRVKGEDFDLVRERLSALAEDNDVSAIYLAALDPEKGRLVYLVDPDDMEGFCPPGSWDEISSEEMDAYINGRKPGRLEQLMGEDKVIPAYIGRTEEYGYLCTAGAPLFEKDGYQVMAFCDLDMNPVAAASKRFLVQYLLLLLGVTLMAGWLTVRILKRKVVAPIDQLATAARAYTRDRDAGDTSTEHFRELDISTGDEIENLALTLQDMEGDLVNYVANLSRVTAEKERINTELTVASQIQEGMVPHIFPAFPERDEFDIYASMTTAKEVGGDFYDFFLIDSDHLAVVMADVSGKGIPAALFMMASKILLSNQAVAEKGSPASILAHVNDQICANNTMEMFVTVWMGILELSTGKMTCANAGHEYPVIRRADGTFELLKDRHGFVLGGIAGSEYHDYEVTLAKGDAVFQYTDGVTEAANAENELFGTERLLASLNRKPDAAPKEVLDNIMEDVLAFTKDAEQFDDITMLCLTYHGPSKKEGMILEVAAERDRLSEVIGALEEYLEQKGCPMKEQTQIEMAVEEIFINIASYAYPDGPGTARLTFSGGEKEAVVTFRDYGIPYDPLAREDPDVTLSAEERKIGGLGIYLVKTTMDKTAYRYEDGQNVFTITKGWE